MVDEDFETPKKTAKRHLSAKSDGQEARIAIEEEGCTVRQVTNIIHKTTKAKLPIFFIDLDPAEINKEIFNLTSLLHTRVKIEEPHKRKEIVQCLNCQEYEVFKPHQPIGNSTFTESIKNSLTSALPLYLAPKSFSPAEVLHFINTFPLKKTPGIDLITAEVAR
ncbi:hypothetical protein QTP88_019802 [Uroleucon formosanum]